jgi:hypothetical protein
MMWRQVAAVSVLLVAVLVPAGSAAAAPSVVFDDVVVAATYPDFRHNHGDRDTFGLPMFWIGYSRPTDCMPQVANKRFH